MSYVIIAWILNLHSGEYQVTAFGGVTPCSLVVIYRRFSVLMLPYTDTSLVMALFVDLNWFMKLDFFCGIPQSTLSHFCCACCIVIRRLIQYGCAHSRKSQFVVLLSLTTSRINTEV